MLNACARESKARTGRFLKEKLSSDHGLFCFYEGKIRETFSGMHRALGDWMLAGAPASPAQGLHHHGPHHGPRYFNFPDFCTMYSLEKLGLVDQNWSERDLSALLLRTLAAGRRQQFESVEVALDIME